jgi:hypothetical protein
MPATISSHPAAVTAVVQERRHVSDLPPPADGSLHSVEQPSKRGRRERREAGGRPADAALLEQGEGRLGEPTHLWSAHGPGEELRQQRRVPQEHLA